MKGNLWPVLAGAAVAVMLAAQAVAADDFETCNKESGDVAIAACTRAITSDKYRGTDLATLFNRRGVELESKGDRDRAIVDFNDWVRLAPDRAEALHARGELYTDFGWYDLALADLDESLKSRPNDAPTLDGRGRVHLFLKQFVEAIRDFDTALRYAPYFYNSLYARGWAKRQIGDMRAGERDIAKAKSMKSTVEQDWSKYYGIMR
jgi:tetratricopeptide (TPR) repeat protein